MLPVIGGFLSLPLLLTLPPWQGVRGGAVSLGITGELSSTGRIGNSGTARSGKGQGKPSRHDQHPQPASKKEKKLKK